MPGKSKVGVARVVRRSRYAMGKRIRACNNTLFNVYFDRISVPGGERVEKFLVVSPKARSPAGLTGVAVLPVVGGRFGLLNLYRHPVARNVWEAPRGFIDKNENAAQAALRELEEETGLRCARRGLIPLGNVFPEAGILAAKVGLFAAELNADSTPALGEEFGHREFRLVTQGEFERMMNDGRIQDPTTLVAYFKYLQRAPAARRARKTTSTALKGRRD